MPAEWHDPDWYRPTRVAIGHRGDIDGRLSPRLSVEAMGPVRPHSGSDSPAKTRDIGAGETTPSTHLGVRDRVAPPS